jgi:hypothetical protein
MVTHCRSSGKSMVFSLPESDIESQFLFLTARLFHLTYRNRTAGNITVYSLEF